MNDHQLAPITEILPPIQPATQSRQTSQSIIRGEDGQLYRLEPLRQTPSNRFEGLWIGLVFVGTIGGFLLFLQALKPAPQPAPTVVAPQPNYTINNPDCVLFCTQ